mmetsp:Transcript_18242/g.61005  ORF Transcript_18242/g.61005 Transcript_18242/m.61005 type:complete len:224 (+) Transcript_18242:2849-3520(+)
MGGDCAGRAPAAPAPPALDSARCKPIGHRGAAASRPGQRPAAALLTIHAGGAHALGLPDVHDLAGVEDVVRVERALDRAHRRDGLRPVLLLEVLHLAAPNAVLPGAGAAHLEGATDEPVVDGLELGHVLRRVIVQHGQDHVEVAVPGVPKNGPHDAFRLHVARGGGHELCEAGDGHAGVRDDALAAGPEGEGRVVGRVPRGPQAPALLLAERPLELAAAIVGT